MSDEKLRVPTEIRHVARLLEMLDSFEGSPLADGECHYLVAQVKNEGGALKWRWKIAVNQSYGPLPSSTEVIDGK